MPVGAAVLFGAALVLAACGIGGSGSSSGPARGYSALLGRRLPGASEAWQPIGHPFVHTKDVGGTIAPPVTTDNADASVTVNFFDFASTEAATTFYNDPPLAARLTSLGILAFLAVPGVAAVPAPARWLDLRECLNAGDPVGGLELSVPLGTLNAAGQCSIGVPTSLGFDEIIQRGDVVVMVQTMGGAPAPGTSSVDAAVNTWVVAQNEKYARSAMELLKKVHLT